MCVWPVDWNWSGSRTNLYVKFLHVLCVCVDDVVRPKNQLSTVHLPENCEMIPLFKDGSLPFQHTHKHSSPLRQEELKNVSSVSSFFFFLSVGGFFKVSPSNMKVPPDHYKGTHPSCWFRLPPWESVKFNCAIMVTCTGRDALKKCVCMPEQSGVHVLMQVAFTTFYITDCSLHSLVLSHLHVYNL